MPPIIKKIKDRLNRRIPVILLHGKIFTDFESINIQNRKQVIDSAFAAAKDVLFLNINSPGGLPVQSQLIHDYIRQSADKKKIKVISFIEDFGASGGYWLATAGDEIYCAPTSIVGSVGVISGSFGLQDFLKEYKIERRLMTAGDAKNRNDMFSPMDEGDKAYMQKILNDMHDIFIQHVKSRRPNIDKAVFDARIAIGENAKGLGLVDGISDIFAYQHKNYSNRKCQFFDVKKGMFNFNWRQKFGLDTDISTKNTPLFMLK